MITLRRASEVADEAFACGPANGRDDSAWREVRDIVTADRLALVERLRELAGPQYAYAEILADLLEGEITDAAK